MELARRHKLVVIEDAAHAAGTEYKGKKIGSFDTTSIFSFHPNKNITTGEGGMIITPSEEIFEKVCLLPLPRHGPQRVEAFREGGFAALRHRDARLQVQHDGHPGGARDPPAPAPRQFHRGAARVLRSATTQAFAGLDALILPTPTPYATRHAWHLYTPLVNLDALTIDRDRFMQELKERNIGVGLHYTAVHEFSYYRDHFGWKPTDFPEAHFVSERIMSLPLFPMLTDDDQDDAIAAVRDVAARFAK